MSCQTVGLGGETWAGTPWARSQTYGEGPITRLGRPWACENILGLVYHLAWRPSMCFRHNCSLQFPSVAPTSCFQQKCAAPPVQMRLCNLRLESGMGHAADKQCDTVFCPSICFRRGLRQFEFSLVNNHMHFQHMHACDRAFPVQGPRNYAKGPVATLRSWKLTCRCSKYSFEK